MLNWRKTGHGIEKGVTAEWLGLIPMLISGYDTTPVAKQVEASYQHGGGWRPLKGWQMSEDFVLTYPGGDPPLKPLFRAEHELSDGTSERVFFYDSAWVNVVQPDGSFEVSRMD